MPSLKEADDSESSRDTQGGGQSTRQLPGTGRKTGHWKFHSALRFVFVSLEIDLRHLQERQRPLQCFLNVANREAYTYIFFCPE